MLKWDSLGQTSRVFLPQPPLSSCHSYPIPSRFPKGHGQECERRGGSYHCSSEPQSGFEVLLSDGAVGMKKLRVAMSLEGHREHLVEGLSHMGQHPGEALTHVL